MNVAFLCRHYGQVNRGAETYVGELSGQLTTLGHRVKIYPDIFSGIDSKTQVIISTNGRLDAILSKMWCLSHHAKLIISGQAGLGWDDKLNLWVFPDVFVGLTDYQCQWAKGINPYVKIVKIPNGVDLTKFNPQVRPIKMDLPRPVVLNVGVVSAFKRQQLLLQAAKKIKVSVLLVGRGGDRNFDHRDMPGVYTACNLFSYPTSPRESFGISILEAMASGLPVVATNDPVRREIIGEAGLFVDPTNAKTYAKALQVALATKWGDKPRQQAAKFSWSRIAASYEKIF